MNIHIVIVIVIVTAIAQLIMFRFRRPRHTQLHTYSLPASTKHANTPLWLLKWKTESQRSIAFQNEGKMEKEPDQTFESRRKVLEDLVGCYELYSVLPTPMDVTTIGLSVSTGLTNCRIPQSLCPQPVVTPPI